MPSSKQTRGTSFEKEVALFLEAQGFRILDRQLRVPILADGYRRRAWVEIDLLAEDKNQKIWIVEAKDHCNAATSLVAILSRPQYVRLMKALSTLRRTYRDRQVAWAISWRNPHGIIEFHPNPCYF